MSDSSAQLAEIADQMYLNQQAVNPYDAFGLLPGVPKKSESDQVSIDLTAGLLFWAPIRNMVGMLGQKGWKVSLWEGHGGLVRPFIITGDRGAVDQIVKRLEEMEKPNE